LEWYRVGFGLSQLMNEVEALFALLLADLGLGATERISYREAFLAATGLDPLVFDKARYSAYAQGQGLPEALALCGSDPVPWLDFLFSHKVQPSLGRNALTMVYDYPACQSSLARLNSADPRVTERVELFIHGVELGNGYHELAEPVEQERRFDEELALRRQKGLPTAGKDLRLLAALQAGLPDCSGIAIGLDRLLMLLSKSPALADVLAFPIGKA
jgi:elongation factor P--(R)-beta-lysine ligase